VEFKLEAARAYLEATEIKQTVTVTMETACIAAEHESLDRICQVAPIYTPIKLHGFLGPRQSAPPLKRHLDRFNRVGIAGSPV